MKLQFKKKEIVYFFGVHGVRATPELAGPTVVPLCHLVDSKGKALILSSKSIVYEKHVFFILTFYFVLGCN